MSPQYDNVLEAALALPKAEQQTLASELQWRTHPVLRAAQKALSRKKKDDGGPDYGGLIARDKSPAEYERRTAQAIREGIAAIGKGRTYTPDEVRKMIPKWVSESSSKKAR